MLTYENQVAKASCNHAFVTSSDSIQPVFNCLQSKGINFVLKAVMVLSKKWNILVLINTISKLELFIYIHDTYIYIYIYIFICLHVFIQLYVYKHIIQFYKFHKTKYSPKNINPLFQLKHHFKYIYINNIITFFIVPTKISTPIGIQKTKYNSMF